MKEIRKCGVLVTVLLLSNAAFGQAPETNIRPVAAEQTPAITVRPAQARLGAADEARLKATIAQHQRVRSQLPTEYRAELDQLTELLKKRLFAAPIRGDLLTSTGQTVGEMVPGLTKPEATSLAEYVLGGIAAGGVNDSTAGRSADSMNVTKSMQDTQMSFNLQYLQLQSQMQSENRAYTAVSNIMKTRHDTVKNSINNVR